MAPENDYLEPIKSPEKDNPRKFIESNNTKQYEGLKEEYVDMAGYEKMHEAQDVQTEETQKSERHQLKDLTELPEKSPRDDEDEHGYLKMK